MPTGIEETIFDSAAKAVIARASPAILSIIGRKLKKETMRLQVQLTKTFQGHLARSIERSANIKTVISRDKPVSLEEIYVPLTLKTFEKDHLSAQVIDPCAKRGARLILSGTGGAGKTVLIKHLLNQTIHNGLGLIPIFVELRNLQFDSGDDLQTCIFNDFRLSGETESLQLFETALEEGLFAIFLDGFDEIHPEEQEKALRFIRRFSDQYAEISILISTRPKTAVETLMDYEVFHLEPLTKEQAIELVKKTEFEEVTKSKFLSSLETDLYDKHQTLMSLPILVGMMLLAYRTYADIPDRMTVFYSQAFETLYSIHDAENKELFKRQHHAGLAPDVFKSVLQAFCYLSLSNHDIEFTEATLDSYIQRALSISKVNVPLDKYRNNLIHNVCVIQPEGPGYVFVHRSFQEYFSSLFAINYSGNSKYKVFDQIINVSGSAVAHMMMEIDAIKTRRYWLLPRCRDMHKYLSRVSRRRLDNQITSFCTVIWVDEKGVNSNLFSYSLGIEGDNNYRVMELIADCSGRDLGFTRILDRIKIPEESRLKGSVAPEEIRHVGRRGPRPFRIAYQRREVYPFSKMSEEILEGIGIKNNLSIYRGILLEYLDDLERDVLDHTILEDNELFT
jgi:hypothetical protein